MLNVAPCCNPSSAPTMRWLLLAAILGSVSAISLSKQNVVAKADAKLHQDCWKSRPVASKAHLSLITKTPGFGTDESIIEPFVTVTKDGYMYVDCVKDAMVVQNDKHGKGKNSYNSAGNVSIVWYDHIVPKEDREGMTKDVCFNFCRTVENATFFGLAEGRKCYCAPYYIQAAGDSSQCDAVCEGDKRTMCGGMKKQSIFAMHMCDDTEEQLTLSKKAATANVNLCTDVHNAYKFRQETLKTLGEALKETAGTNGDTISLAHGNTAMAASSEAYKVESRAKAVADDTTALRPEGAEAKTDFSNSDDLVKAEKLIADTKALGKTAAKTCAPFKARAARIAATGGIESSGAKDEKKEDAKEKKEEAEEKEEESKALEQYYPVTYFVEADKELHNMANFGEAVPSTCKGPGVEGDDLSALVVKDAEQCAHLCDTATSAKCIGFEYYKPEDEDYGLCVPLSDVKEVSYYKCKEDAPAETEEDTQQLGGGGGVGFLQKMIKKHKKHTKGISADGVGIVCAVKFSQMNGFTNRLNSKRAGVDHVPVNVLNRCF